MNLRVIVIVLAATAAALLGSAATAGAGGWATADLSSTPAGVAPGEPWNVEMTVLQHGRTPLDGVRPGVVISRGETVRRFPARPTGRPGIYRARVVFPTGGTWRYATDDGFGGTHDFPAVRIGAPADATAAPAAPADDDGLPWWLVPMGVLVLAAVGAATLARRGHTAGPATS